MAKTQKTQNVNFKWQQGEDLRIELIYKEGDSTDTAVAVPLSSGYALQMDLVVDGSDDPVYSLSSDDADVVLSNGSATEPNITIYLSRALTLPDGDLYDEIDSGEIHFQYDIFLRNTEIDKQIKVLKGTITVEDSRTLWA